MKLEKREITLNEADSLRDMLYTEKTVLEEYVKALEQPLSKQTQNELISSLQSVAMRTCETRTLLQGILEQSEK